MTLGRTRWVVPGVRVPMGSHGPEPEMSSRDQLALLNTGTREAQVELMAYGEDEQVGPFHCEVGARRLRLIGLGDLIDPRALLLDTPYAVVVDSDVPIVVQFTRYDTRQAALATAGGLAFHERGDTFSETGE
ncbi:hypothetical protein HII36_14935 [Nonomuraea sp. NN258]|uniref:sensory rhodopsin transducer n=1 Tax=Nonomuraea antri TaxID=2730852 RepID=UPI00156848FA|nr:sensory rhodopsin transducer [Nonomuraea antri]NRQ33128.1 hypothetical protein [Nonomuraea antri]